MSNSNEFNKLKFHLSLSQYYYKYLKYKIKYINHKDKKAQLFKSMINNDINKGLLNIDFLHDLPSDKIKNKEFYNMIDEDIITIYNGSQPEDLESFIHNEIIDLINGEESVVDKLFKKVNDMNNEITKDLSQYTVILDKSADNIEIVNKLKSIFSITNFEDTFIGNCERFLNNKNATINKKYIGKKYLKPEYMLEAIKVGFLPISINRIINFNAIVSKNPQTIYDELMLIKQYILETYELFKKKKFNFKNDNFSDQFIDFLLKLLDDINNNIKHINDITSYYMNTDKNMKLMVERLVFSLKESRDIYYIEEIKQLKTINPTKPYLLVSGDLVQSYRAIIDEISTINLMLSMIRFIALYKNNTVSFIGNPFEHFSSNVKIIDSDIKKKEIIQHILSNPIIRLNKNIKLNSKYISMGIIHNKQYLDYIADIIKDDKFIPSGIKEQSYDLYNDMEKEISSTTTNIDIKKKIMDHLLLFAKNNIMNETDLINCFIILRQMIGYDISNDSIDKTINIIETNLDRIKKDYPDKKIKLSTLHFQIFYLLIIRINSSMLEYVIPLAQTLYPNDFDWDEIDMMI